MTSGEDIAVEYTTEVEARSMSVPDSGEGSSGNGVGRGRVGEGGGVWKTDNCHCLFLVIHSENH